MPPKGSQKPKAAASSTPKPKAKPKSAKSPPESATASTTTATPKSASKKPATPASSSRKKKEPPVYKAVAHEAAITMQIDVKQEGNSIQAQQVADGVFSHTLKLQAPNPFTLVKTIKFTSGEFEGCEAIVLQPAKPFPFLKLPNEVCAKIYSFYFAPNRITNSEIALEGKRSNKDIFAKMYAEGSKYRVGLLTINKEVYEDAVQILYCHTMRFENTTTVLDFLGQLPSAVRPRVTKVAVQKFLKTSGRNAMHFLAECPGIVSLHIESSVYTGDDPAKGAKEFHDAAYKFLEAVGARKGDKKAAVDMLSFGRDAFMTKSTSTTASRPWPKADVDEFREALKGKLD